MYELEVSRTMSKGKIFEVTPECQDVDGIPDRLGPRVLLLHVGFQVTVVDMIADVIIKVAIKSSFKDHDRDCCRRKMFGRVHGSSRSIVKLRRKTVNINIELRVWAQF